jgi:hypothetical protein
MFTNHLLLNLLILALLLLSVAMDFIMRRSVGKAELLKPRVLCRMC